LIVIVKLDILLGFYNATPVDQPAAVADATGAGDVVAQLNALLSRVRELCVSGVPKTDTIIGS
jgi:hypothetical protein